MAENRRQWLDEAVGRIRFWPDRKAVLEELTAHIQDRSDDLVARGYTRAEADERTLLAMGDPVEVGRQLDAVHKPLLGWVWKLSRWLVILVMAVTVYCLIGRGWGVFSWYGGPNRYEQSVAWKAEHYGEVQRTPAAARAEWDRYTFRVEELVTCGDGSPLTFRLVIDGFLPWEECLLLDEMYAVDSLGNRYQNLQSMYTVGVPERRLDLGWSYNRTLFSWEYEGELVGLHPEAEWFELRRDLPEQEIVLHVELPGGGA